MKLKFKISAKRFLVPLYLLIFSLVFINTAWLGDDIFITFRAVDNFLKGYGPVWNVGERVQVFTHPLWYALLVIGIGIFKHHYWFTLALSYACLLGTLLLFLKIARHGSMALAMLASVALLLSRAFADYSSSGLENPLQHLLLCSYVLIAITQQDAAKRFLHTSLLYSLLFLTRPDAIFLVTPASLWMFWQAYKACGWKRTLKLAAIAAAPALAWEAFSLIYYGSLVPNTAIAKTHLGYPRPEMLARGVDYMKVSFLADPFTLGTILLAFALVAWRGKGNLPHLLMAGVALQLLYICWVGGDYMVGHFLTSPLLVAAIAIALSKTWKININIRKELPAIVGVVCIIFSILYTAPAGIKANIQYTPNYNTQSRSSFWSKASMLGMPDQRALYYPALGLLPIIKKHHRNPYTHEQLRLGQQTNAEKLTNAMLLRSAGMMPWGAGRRVHFIDTPALTDPFLARMPLKAAYKQLARPHTKSIPQGYLTTLITGKNSISHPTMAALYDDTSLAAHGAIFSKRRWKSIWRLNSGFYNITREDSASHADEFINSVALNTPYNIVATPAREIFSKDAADTGSVDALQSVIFHTDGKALSMLAGQAIFTQHLKASLTEAARKSWYFLISEAAQGREGKLKALLDAGINANAPDINGYYPLEIASYLGSTESIQLLLDCGIPVNSTNKSARTALMQAAQSGHTDAIKLLLDRGANINAADKLGETALSLALAESNTAIAKMLLAKGAKPGTALAPISRRGHLGAAQFLLAQGANINHRRGGASKMTPLMQAAYVGQKDMVTFLLEKGANVNALTAQEETALSMALNRNRHDIAKILLAGGANPDDALLPASWGNNLSAVRFLLQHGANINHAGGVGVKWTPLMHAAYHGHRNLVAFLLKNGADINARDSFGETAIQLASKKNHAKTVKILRKAGAVQISEQRPKRKH